MRFQVKSQTTPIVNREAAEVTLVLGKLIPMTGDVPFQIEFLVSAIRAKRALQMVLFLLSSRRLQCRSWGGMHQLDVCNQALVLGSFEVAIPTILVTHSSTAEIVPLFCILFKSWICLWNKSKKEDKEELKTKIYFSIYLIFNSNSFLVGFCVINFHVKGQTSQRTDRVRAPRALVSKFLIVIHSMTLKWSFKLGLVLAFSTLANQSGLWNWRTLKKED